MEAFSPTVCFPGQYICIQMCVNRFLVVQYTACLGPNVKSELCWVLKIYKFPCHSELKYRGVVLSPPCYIISLLKLFNRSYLHFSVLLNNKTSGFEKRGEMMVIRPRAPVFQPAPSICRSVIHFYFLPLSPSHKAAKALLCTVSSVHSTTDRSEADKGWVS